MTSNMSISAQGRGEATWVGFEAAGSARVRVNLIKGGAPPFPRLFIHGAAVFTAFSAFHSRSASLVLEQAYEVVFSRLNPLNAWGGLWCNDGKVRVWQYLVSEEGGSLTPDEAHAFLTAQVQVFSVYGCDRDADHHLNCARLIPLLSRVLLWSHHVYGMGW